MSLASIIAFIFFGVMMVALLKDMLELFMGCFLVFVIVAFVFVFVSASTTEVREGERGKISIRIESNKPGKLEKSLPAITFDDLPDGRITEKLRNVEEATVTMTSDGTYMACVGGNCFQVEPRKHEERIYVCMTHGIHCYPARQE